MLLTAMMHITNTGFASLELGNSAFQPLDHFTMLHLLLVLTPHTMVLLALICAMRFPYFI